LSVHGFDESLETIEVEVSCGDLGGLILIAFDERNFARTYINYPVYQSVSASFLLYTFDKANRSRVLS
jgi:hypothetical protein